MKNPEFIIRKGIREEISETISMIEIESLSVNSLAEIVKKYNNRTYKFYVNPIINITEIKNYLTSFQLLKIQFLRLIIYFLFLSVLIFSIVYLKYEFLVVLPFIILFSIFPRPFNYSSFHAFNFVLLALFAAINYKFHVFGISCLSILTIRFVKLLESLVIRKAILLKSFNKETIFKTLYLKNIIIVSDLNKYLNSKQESQKIADRLKEKHQIELTNNERLYYCKQCKNRIHNFKKGILCKLSNNRPDFRYNCDQFKIDKSVKNKVEEEYSEKQKNFKSLFSTISFGENIFYLISGLILISIFNYYTNSHLISPLSSGILEFLNKKTDYNLFYLGIALSSIFIIIGLLSRVKPQIGYILGIVIYGIDFIFSMLNLNYWGIWIHLLLFVIIGASFRGIKALKEYYKHDLRFLDK